jgi:hypothetical protein
MKDLQLVDSHGADFRLSAAVEQHKLTVVSTFRGYW